MSDAYQIVWDSGHVETVHAEQVSWPNNYARHILKQDAPDIVNFHDTIDGKWTLVLQARSDEIMSIRNLTRAPGGLA